MKSLEVWRSGYKAEFSPGLGRSKCKVSPLPCLPWDSVGGVGQGRFRILHKSGIEFPGAGRSPGLAVWPGMLGRLAAWVERLGGGLIGCRRSRFPGLGRAGASCWPCILSASAGCWSCLVSSGAGSLLVPAGLCWALTAWGLLGAGSGSAWASLAPGSPPWCRAGGCPGRASGGGWAG